jgi:hypothetical protein
MTKISVQRAIDHKYPYDIIQDEKSNPPLIIEHHRNTSSTSSRKMSRDTSFSSIGASSLIYNYSYRLSAELGNQNFGQYQSVVNREIIREAALMQTSVGKSASNNDFSSIRGIIRKSKSAIDDASSFTDGNFNYISEIENLLGKQKEETKIHLIVFVHGLLGI